MNAKFKNRLLKVSIVFLRCNFTFLYLTLNWFTHTKKIHCNIFCSHYLEIYTYYHFKLMSVDFFSPFLKCSFKDQWVFIIVYLFRRICTFLAGSHTVHCTFNGQFWHFSGGERHSQICRQRYNPCRWMGKCLFTGKNTYLFNEFRISNYTVWTVNEDLGLLLS